MNLSEKKTQALTNEERVALVQRQRRQLRNRDLVLAVSGVVLFFVIWEVLSVTKLVDAKYISEPVQIFQLFITKLSDPNPDGAVLAVNIWSSLQVALCGFGLAGVIGVPLGWLMGWYRGFDSFIYHDG